MGGKHGNFKSMKKGFYWAVGVVGLFYLGINLVFVRLTLPRDFKT